MLFRSEAELVKRVPGARWDKDSRTWQFPINWAAGIQLRGIFRDGITYGDVLAARGDFDDAMAEYRWAADTLGMMSANRQSASVWRALGDRLLGHGDLEGAIRAYDRALREAGIRPTNLPVVTSAMSTSAALESES